MNDAKRTLWYLKKIELLAELGPEVLARLAERVEMREVRRREVVYLPGDPGKSVFFVNGGRVKICKVTRDGKSLTLGYCGPSEMFGDAALVGAGPRAEMAEAVENVLLTEIERADLERLIASNAGLAAGIARLMITRRHELENKIEALVFRDVSSKLAEQLIKLGDEFGIDDARGTLVALKITHQELANLIGSTRETISLTLAQFKKKGLLDLNGRTVVLRDQDGLGAMT